jgi:predicted short-subunit dehydrogenase-like oxidoreductase (DUF2520 family)
MFKRVHVIGSGRAGGAIAARLEERGVDLTTGREPDPDAELIILAVPDSVIAEVAQRTPVGPWLAHVSGATPLAALDPHTLRFSVHPLMTFTRDRGAEQLDGAFAAVSFETDAAATRADWLARALGLRPFPLADADRALYHAGAAIASNFLVTLYRTAARLFDEAGAPPDGLVPLMQRTIDNGFQLTGPIARGDWSTVDAHLAALRDRAPEVEPLYRALAKATKP